MTLDLIRRFAAHDVVRQFLRFAVVGAMATAVHYSVLIALKEMFHVPLVVATSVGFLVGALVSYVLNRRFTFSVRPAFGLGLVKFLAALGVGLLLNGAIVGFLAHEAQIPYMIAQLAATGLVLFWNFASTRLLVFRE